MRGPLQARDGDRVIECAHCGTRFLTRLEDGFARRYFPAKVERLQAVGAAARWLWEHPDAPSDIRESAFVEAHLLYVPIWEARAHLVGWEFGKKLRNRTQVVKLGEEEIVRTELVEQPVEEGFFGERRFYQEAADLDALGMGRPHITGREFTLPYLVGELERGASVLQTDGDLAAVRETGANVVPAVHPPARRPPTPVCSCSRSRRRSSTTPCGPCAIGTVVVCTRWWSTRETGASMLPARPPTTAAASPSSWSLSQRWL